MISFGLKPSSSLQGREDRLRAIQKRKRIGFENENERPRHPRGMERREQGLCRQYCSSYDGGDDLHL